MFLFIIVSIYLSITISTPIFYFQTRAGKKGKPFRLYKFRTMANKIGIKDEKFESERKRVLKSTYFLRLFKLDEIPQFLNIIKGDLSLVGPRPILFAIVLNLYNLKGLPFFPARV